MKIDGETVIPIGWVISGAVTIVVCTITATFWVAGVNARLGRIEQKLGIKEPYSLTATPLIREAEAATR